MHIYILYIPFTGPGIPIFILDDASWPSQPKTHNLLEQYGGSAVVGRGAFKKRGARTENHPEDHQKLDGKQKISAIEF